ncbi:MAG: ATP-dependent DNA helicase UvrD2 [Acidimicrobiales bacterium]|nr:ATP-dependent DNA helicase UvrD2 [Acidimicrobiales bacterium]
MAPDENTLHLDESSNADALLVGLNEEQHLAVTTDATPLAIHAGAGSGKTRVLTHRIAWRAETGREDPRRVMALTFTRKAAAELRHRLRRLGLRDQVAAGTFHAIAFAQLRNWWQDNGQKEPELLTRKIGFIAPLLPRDRRTTDALDVTTEIEWAKARRIRPEAYASLAEETSRNTRMAPAIIASIYHEYEELKTKRSLVDFDDLLENCAKAIRGDKAFGNAQRWRFRHFYVDEFQDVNPLQMALLTAWLGGSNDLCVVGDPDQAIYGWNGAEADHLVRFTTHFPDGQVIDLHQNYRSTPQILRTAASALVGRPPLLANRPSGSTPTVTVHADDQAEARAIAQSARDSKGPTGRWAHQAVLVRTNAQAETMATALRQAQIPIRTRAGSGLMDRADIKGTLTMVGRSKRPLNEHLGDLRSGDLPADLNDAQEIESARDSERANAFAELQHLAHEYLSLDPGGTGAGFVKWAREQARTHQDDSIDAVEIATFHAAKGLEWPIVHVAGVEQGLVPIGHARDTRSRAEERRLLYVALSRAKDHLHISWAAERRFGEKMSRRQPSPWLEDVEFAILNLDQPLEKAQQAQRVKQVRQQVSRKQETDSPVLDTLKTWRNDLARANDVDPWKVFNNATLEALVALWPTEQEQLVAVSGIGPFKADRHGKALLDILGRFERPNIPAPSAPAAKKKAAPPAAQTNPDLASALKKWRMDQAAGKPAFTVFTNASLDQLVTHRPTTEEELLAITGIGPAKVARFGEALLSFLAQQP